MANQLSYRKNFLTKYHTLAVTPNELYMAIGQMKNKLFIVFPSLQQEALYPI